ncbi:hypothetical protein BDF20DRAFT_870691 [Mycotypha africana]|uniref:uncharacterized protein n=1 Tax=Mycotypha africana TaxID=64632 RepID=UPI00230130DA|nr:uncharacterized protein BDF20DRAFT_870691 [Mycotypha africana]KAI8979620.1 hypothetical protein BDF20DRAFT_870691 [Mycotypha africana]
MVEEKKKLTKREKKAEAFKKRAKKAQFTEDMAVPASDDPPAVEEEQPQQQQQQQEKATTEQATTITASQQNTTTTKRKAEGQPIDTPKDESAEEPSRKKNKKNTQSKEGGNQHRFIVFVGNLPYTTTKEELAAHFESAGNVKSVRLLTDKKTGKPKGFAFMEFESAKDLKKALGFHHTFFKKRQINVELTAGGGGNKSDARKEKLKVKNERLREERQKKFTEAKGKNEQQSSYQSSNQEES